ncbi:hypothetical protein BOX15_Mlig006964g2 [Macrostomum lignano]|uniref:Tetraspanin n=1 Tax=Macrostomum lignano TaxID=282301 RepID=A0A267EA85_9PLAT|nr:hypothetical protein BOX15_Mlig006964g2 [Macrostomum lignano]
MCFQTFMKILTGILSIVFLILGIALMIVGFILQFGKDVLVKYLEAYTNELNEYLKAAGAQFNVSDYIGYLPSITGNVPVVFIVMGAVMAVVGIIGLVAICKENKCALTIYIIILAVLIVGQLTLVIVYYAARDTFSARAREYMQQTIDTKYTGYNNTNMETVLWNVFHMSLSCCGINNGSDFLSSTTWPRYVNYSGKYYDSVAYPLTCCKLTNWTACLHTNHTDAAYSNWNIGCYNLIDRVVQINIVYAALGTAAVLLLQVLILDFSVHLCRKAGEKDI